MIVLQGARRPSHLCSTISLEFHRLDLVEADDARWLVDEDEGLGR